MVITVRDARVAPKGEFAGQVLRFYPVAEGFQALAALSVDQAPGTIPLEVKIAEDRMLTAELEVREPTWRTRELQVAAKFVKPPKSVARRRAADTKAFKRAFAQPWTPPRFSEPFAWPRKDVLTAYFGDRRTYNGELQSQHYGTDIDGSMGDPVQASNDGRVVMVRDNYASGLTVVIDHGASVYTTYFHLSRVDVKPKQRVKRGQLLGGVGKSGRVTGPHLHFGVKINDRYVDAETLFKLDFSALGASGAAPAPATKTSDTRAR